jgi:hypothetical protein
MFHKLNFGFCLIIVIGICAACRGASTATPIATPTEIPAPIATDVSPFPIYTDQGASGSTFVPSGWMGDAGGITLDDTWSEDPYEGETCIHISYEPQSEGPGWAGVYWMPSQLDPSEDWGAQVDGENLNGVSRLSLWARGVEGGEPVEFFVGGIEGPQGDSLGKKSLTVTLTPEWREYSINLNGADMSSVVGAFGWSAAKEVEFWVDEVQFQ